MPELPEVETMRRGISPVEGRRIVAVQRPPCGKRPIQIRPRLDALRRRTLAQRIIRVARRGKRVLIHLDSHDTLVIEPRMTGLVLLNESPDPQYLRLRISLDGPHHWELLYWDRRGLGTVRLMTPRELEDALGEEKLGPDALTISPVELRKRLGSSRREIKTALLDQRAVAGIGNLYAAEILHIAGVHPQKHCDRMTSAQWTAVTEATHAVLHLAIRYEGSTLSDGTYRNALNRAGRYQNQHRVYAKAGQPCQNGCGATILRIVQTGRSTFFCPRCQRKAARNSRTAP